MESIVEPPPPPITTTANTGHHDELKWNMSRVSLSPDETDIDLISPIGRACFPPDTMLQRLWDRVRLVHVPPSSETPAYLIIKIALVSVIAQLLDIATRNPDHVTTVFVGILGLTPFLQLAKLRAADTLVMGLMGATVGTLISAATFLPNDTSNWMYLLSVPWSVCTTYYVLFFVNRVDPPAIATACFSSLFVILVKVGSFVVFRLSLYFVLLTPRQQKYQYPPISSLIPPDDPRSLIWQTLLVRVLALLTGCGTALMVNLVVSALAPLAILKTEVFFTERLVWRSCHERASPGSQAMQDLFSQVVNLLSHGTLATESTKSWIFGPSTRKQTAKIVLRTDAIFRYLNLVAFLEICAKSKHISDAGRSNLDKLLEWLRDEVSTQASNNATMQVPDYVKDLTEKTHILPLVIQEVLHDLDCSRLKYRESNRVSRFWGRA